VRRAYHVACEARSKADDEGIAYAEIDVATNSGAAK
jgi:hypothetical protein